MIRIEKRGRRVEIRSSEPLPGLKTTIPGAYQAVGGYWTVPLNLESCKLLQEKYGRRLAIGTELKRWAIGIQQTRKYLKELSASDDAELERLHLVAPALAKAMDARTYQRVGARFIADNLPATLIADDPGLGKTLIALGGILEAGVEGPYLIVAPKTAADSVWRREILRWLPKGHRPFVMPDYRSQREHRLNSIRYGPKSWVIVHPEMVQTLRWLECQECEHWTKEGYVQDNMLECGHPKDRKTEKIDEHSYPKLFAREWGAIIVDESHESLIRRSGKQTQRRHGLDLLRVRADGIKIAMSGTPFDSKPQQLWGTLNWLDPVQYSAFNRWAEMYWQKGGYTGHKLGEFRNDREAMLWDSLSAIAIRRTKAEVAADLPPKIYVGAPLTPSDEDSPAGIWLEMDGPQAKAYNEFAQMSMVELQNGQLNAIIALEELTRLKQLACAHGDIEWRKVWATDEETGDRVLVDKSFYKPTLPSNKLKWIIESLEEWGFPRNPITKVVLVSFYTGILELFREALEIHFKTKPSRPMCTAITGRTPSKDRRAIIDRFNQSGGPTVMLLNTKAGGTAITLDTADRMIFVSETRIPDQQQQAEDRIHRISNPRTCMYYYLRSLGTVDVGTALVNQEMIHDTHRLLDQRRGVDYMRQIMELSS